MAQQRLDDIADALARLETGVQRIEEVLQNMALHQPQGI